MEEFLKDLYKAECQRSHMYLIINYVLTVLLLVALITCGCLFYELSTYEQVEITTTTETYTQDIEGDNGSIVNGNQYNDSATHNEGSALNGESTADQKQGLRLQ